MGQEDNNPLLFAASKGALDAVYAAIQQGIDINTEDQVSNLTLFYLLSYINQERKKERNKEYFPKVVSIYTSHYLIIYT